ncbi:hypothetical protein L2E82_08067 [Cichorium intybus]|uniref:Uncharacterized protein n=1 Tax=Cichorium intybus TaxID=13427 RepID=A0ACB9G5J6_CICIN|nr:hypothetical protein L2E82_08067 [Cichorium intybus]
MKKNRYVETLRNTSMPFPDLCAQLLDGTMSTGIKSWGSSSVEPYIPTFESQSVEDEELEILNDTIRPTCSSSSQPQPLIKNKKSKGKQSINVVEEKILGVLEMIANKINKPEPPPKPTFEYFLSKLNKLGWPEYDPTYQVAIALFSDENYYYRDCRMQLKPELCLNWVTMIRRSKGFM